MEQVYPYALTTLQRCKDRIFDAAVFTITGTTVSSSNSITSVSSTTGILVGQAITGAGIPYGTTIAAIGSGTLTLSQNATASASGVALIVANQPVAFDALLTRLVNGVTDMIERTCGKSGPEMFPNDGHFVQKTYTNEVYSAAGHKQVYLPLRNSPVTYLIVTGDLTQGSAAVANVTPSVGIVAGMQLYSIQGLFPQGTTVLSVSGSSVTMSQPASITLSGAVFEISGLLSFEWRAGTPSNPSWTSFITDQFELKDQGRSGIIRVYGAIPGIYNNMLRATYVAGFPVDWQNAGNGTTHQLPADLTNTCENVVTRLFKRRQQDGKSSENIQGATTSWRSTLDTEDQDTITRYTRVGTIF